MARDVQPDGYCPTPDPRVKADRYMVYPTGYEAMVHSDKIMWCLSVVDGHGWGWAVKRAAIEGGPAMNRSGEWIYESRGSGRNKARRWSLEEALAIALQHVDTHTINGHTAAQASASVAARKAGIEVPD